MPGGTGILILTVDNLLASSSLCKLGYVCVYVYLSSHFSTFFAFHRCWLSKSSSIRRQEDDRRISVRCYNLVCRDPAVKYVAPLAASQTHCVTSYIQRTHTQTHSRGVCSHPCTCAHRITLICRKTQQQQTMSVLFISGLDVPNCFKDFLWLAAVGVSKCVYAVSFFFFFRKQCDERFPWLVLYSSLIIVRNSHFSYW